MQEPIKDLWKASPLPGVLLQDTTTIGELHGRLFSILDEKEYLKRGGAKYICNYRLANRKLVLHSSSSPIPGGDIFSEAREQAEQVKRLHKRLLCKWRAVTTRILKVTSFLFPPFRLGVPSAVFPSLRASAQRTRGERVSAIVFHPFRPLLAVAIDEVGLSHYSRVLVFDVVEDHSGIPMELCCVLTHAFQKDVRVLAWKLHSQDILAVGCEGGVLLWSLEPTRDENGDTPPHSRWWEGENPKPLGHPRGEQARDSNFFSTFSEKVSPKTSSLHDRNRSACCVFYAHCDPSAPITTLAFSNATGQFLVAGSCFHCSQMIFDVSLQPCHPSSSRKFTPSIDGGSERILFAADDSYVLSLTSGHASLTLTPIQEGELLVSTRIGTPFPILDAQPARGIGPAYYFFQVGCTEGIILARVDLPGKSVEIITLISTHVHRGIGGAVRVFACSKRRLWIVTETSHLLVCDYHGEEQLGGQFTLNTVGAATMDASALASFSGFNAGSLLAVIEQEEVLHLVPSYHA